MTAAAANVDGPTVRVAGDDTAHRGASLSNREVAGWQPLNLSADAAILPELDALVGRSSDLLRNHGTASVTIETILENVVGHILRLVAQPDAQALGRDETWAEGWAREMEAIWRSYSATTEFDASRKLTFLGSTELLYQTQLTKGGAVALPLWMPGRRSDGWATCYQLVDPDRLCNPQGKFDGPRLRAGIELDDYGAAVGYWLRKSHPGDAFLEGGLPTYADDWDYVPARTEFGRRQVLHLHRMEEIGQNRGRPLFSASLPAFRMLDHYERAEVAAAVIQARMALIMKSNLPPEAMMEMFGGRIGDFLTLRDEWRAKLESGSIIQAFPNDEPYAFNPTRPSNVFPQFCEQIERRLSNTANIPMEVALKKFAGMNYSNARVALGEAERGFLNRRRRFNDQWHDPVYELCVEEAIGRRLIEDPGFYRDRTAVCQCRWIGPGRIPVDAEKEGNAATIAMGNGTSTQEQECAARGLDWEDVQRQRIRERVRLRELEDAAGLTPESEAAPTPASPGGGPANEPAQEEPA